MGHANIIKFCNRPFSDVTEMNEKMIYNWNSVVKPEDIIYCLGDFSLSFRPVELYSNRLNGQKKIVPGNHDHLHSYNRKSRKPEDRLKWIQKYEEHGWEVLDEQTHIYALSDDHGIHKLNLCHFPKVFEFYDDKYERWRPEIPEDEWLLHGHKHSAEQKHLNARMIDIGVDANNYKPVSISQIFDLINPT
jgi:calcineurin-like phosphoesterase family protein